MLGLAGRGGGQTGQAAAPSGCRTSPCRSGWGFWESELQLTWSKCGQEGPAGCEGAKGGQRENNGHSSPLHVTASSNDEVSASSAQLKMSPGFFGRWQDKGPRLDFFSLNKRTTPTVAPPLSCGLLSSGHHPDIPAEPSLGGYVLPAWKCHGTHFCKGNPGLVTGESKEGHLLG